MCFPIRRLPREDRHGRGQRIRRAGRYPTLPSEGSGQLTPVECPTAELTCRQLPLKLDKRAVSVRANFPCLIKKRVFVSRYLFYPLGRNATDKLMPRENKMPQNDTQKHGDIRIPKERRTLFYRNIFYSPSLLQNFVLSSKNCWNTITNMLETRPVHCCVRRNYQTGISAKTIIG